MAGSEEEVSFFQVKRKETPAAKKGGDGLPMSATTDAKPADEKKTEPALVSQPTAVSKNEPNVAMEEVADKIQKLVDEGKAELVSDDNKDEDEKDNDGPPAQSTAADTPAEVAKPEDKPADEKIEIEEQSKPEEPAADAENDKAEEEDPVDGLGAAEQNADANEDKKEDGDDQQ